MTKALSGFWGLSAPARRAYCGFVRHGPRATGVTRVTEADDAGAATPTAEKDPGRAGWLFGAATVAIAVGFTAWQLAERTEQIIHLRDPATYLQVAYWIAHHGYLPIPDSSGAFGGPHPGLSFASSNYYPRGTGIVPQFMTGTPL